MKPSRCAALLLLMALIVALPPAPLAAPVSPEAGRSHFAWVDIYVDAGALKLAAYQFELTAESGQVGIVGVEGGEHSAFLTPPYYDPAALHHGRIILAAFNTGRDLPQGKTRVARVHFQVFGEATPEYVVKLTVAADAEGKPIEAKATVVPGEAK